MKVTTAVLAGGAAISLAPTVVGAGRLRQDARHQAERNEAIVARNQLDWHEPGTTVKRAETLTENVRLRQQRG
ncbi:hypothetical protein [Streptomyces sp. A5-4]|uniref:hypothetical protein n=1 Tax=Streptomyces sp. A5-4 TaxID=3384771 RepID=UPI003DA810BA